MNVYPGTIPDLGIQLDSPEWFDWLASVNQFKYIGNLTEMSVKRRSNGKWYARKKIYSSSGSKPVDLYIGSDEQCTAEKLQEINTCFAKDWVDFWDWYYSERKQEGKEGVQENMYTLAQIHPQPTPEIEELKRQITELEFKLGSTEKKLEHISFTEDSAGLKKAIAQSLAEIEELQVKRRQDLDFSHIRAVGLSAEIEKLESKLQLPALEKIRDRILLQQSPAKRRELKKVIDVVITELAIVT